MKRLFKSILGVTLLEIMLVLAIAALIIVMSVKYYQSASSANKLNNAMELIEGIVAGVEQYLTANGGLTANLSNNAVSAYLPGTTIPSSPWGGTVNITAGAQAGQWEIIMGGVSSPADCTQIQSLVLQNSKFTGSQCVAPTLTVKVNE